MESMEKPVIYAPIPEFDQCAQAVFQTESEDRGNHIYVGVEVIDLPEQEGEDGDLQLTALR